MSQADAFTDRIFSGNPAAVCVMDKRLSDDLKQSIVSENKRLKQHSSHLMTGILKSGVSLLPWKLIFAAMSHLLQHLYSSMCLITLKR